MLSLLVIRASLPAQSIVYSGTVLDKISSNPLIGANVSFDKRGTVTDIDGKFEISLEESTKIVFSYLGYETVTVEVKESQNDVIIKMEASDNVLDAATVTGSRYEQKIGESTVSIDILPTKLIERTNVTNVSDALVKVPGVQILDGQANIRGGSGFSYGAGSRVILLLNDLPILNPDSAFPNWADVPVENIGQVEVLKGSASATYGSSALNGIINVRTKYATSEPETKVTMGTRVFDGFKREEVVSAEGWKGEAFVNAVHRSKINEDLDIVVHGYYSKLNSYADSTFQNRGRFGFSTKYRISDQLTVGLNGMINRAHNSSFFIWRNNSDAILKPLPGTVSETRNTRLIIDPYITYFDKWKGRHKLQARYYFVNNDNSLNQSNASKNLFTEYQYQKDIEQLNLKLTGGIVNQFLNTDSELFSDTQFSAYNVGGYLQLDQNLFQKLNLSAGARYEFNNLTIPDGFEVDGNLVNPNGLDDGRLIYKAGLNFQLAEYSFLRSSYGQGYRYPTIVERFISTTFGSFGIFSNPELLPESGYNLEVGLKQGFRVGTFKGFLDLAGFYQRYSNMMEFTFTSINGLFGFQSQNIGDTQIRGFEIGIGGELKIAKLPIRLFGGYTYIDPTYLDFDDSFSLRSSLSSSAEADSLTQNVLKYRSKHNFKIDAELEYNQFTLGVALNSASSMINIDRAFYTFGIGGIREYRIDYGSSYSILDLRVGYKIKNVELGLQLNNVLNKEYTIRPAELEAPRNIGLRVGLSW